MGDFAHYQALWEADRRKARASAKPRKDKAHYVTAKDFLAELELLSLRTNDDVFRRAIVATKRLGVINQNGQWRRTPRKLEVGYSEGSMAQVIKNSVSRGISLRLSCAMLAYELDIESASFEGAIAYLERCYREWRSEEPREEVDTI